LEPGLVFGVIFRYTISSNLTEDKKEMPVETLHTCTQCSNTAAEVKSLIKMNNGDCLCGECITEMKDMVTQIEQASASAAQRLDSKLLTPKQLVAILDQYVIGQADAKKTLSLAVYNHYKRLDSQSTVEISKSNILMVGPTGTGKTLLAQTLARYLNVPFTIADATSLTQAGYVGDDVETILQRLLQAADGDIEKAERGIVFIDEVDKLAKASAGPSVTRDVSGEGVQQSLLKLIEGTRVSVPVTGNRKQPGGAVNYLDTKNILFICAGAFVHLLAELEAPSGPRGIGFFAQDPAAAAQPDMTDLLVKNGMIPEFVGRLPVVTTLTALSAEDLERILVEPKNAVVRQMEALFAMDDAELHFADGALSAVAKKAFAVKTGARGARGVLEGLLKEAQYEVPGTTGAAIYVSAELEVSIEYPAIAACG
jgi:ATP-dependent Clp protease ATP-binding subunit ClpX